MKKKIKGAENTETLRFTGVISEDSSFPFLTLFDQACSEDKGVKIIINSGGGDIDCAFAIYDAIMRSGANVETVAEGAVASAALTVFLAGDTRAMAPHAYIAVHQPKISPPGSSTIDEFSRICRHVKMVQRMYVDIICERTGQSRSRVLRDIIHGRHFYADDAIKCGYAHKII